MTKIIVKAGPKWIANVKKEKEKSKERFKYYFSLIKKESVRLDEGPVLKTGST